MPKISRLAKIRARPVIAFDEWTAHYLGSSAIVNEVDLAWEFLSVCANELNVAPTQIAGSDSFRGELFPGSFCDFVDEPTWVYVLEDLTDRLRPKFPHVDWSQVKIDANTTVCEIIQQSIAISRASFPEH